MVTIVRRERFDIVRSFAEELPVPGTISE